MTSPYPATLTEALVILQKNLPEIKKTEIAKVETQKGSYAYSYADLANIAREVLPRLAELGVAFTAVPEQRGDRLMLVGRLTHINGDSLEGVYPLPTSSRPQDFGSAMTYGRRYLLTGLTGITPEKDDDDAAQISDRAGETRSETRERTTRGRAAGGRTYQREQPAGARPAAARRTGGPALPGERVADDAPWTDDDRRALMAAFGETGATREQRLEISSRLVGRNLDSANELTHGEAQQVAGLVRKAVEEFGDRALDALRPSRPAEGENDE